MAEIRRRAVISAAGAGIIAGIVFGLVEMLAAAAMGNPATAPLRMFASVVVGSDALTTYPLASMAVIGIIVHLILSAIFGLLYGLIMQAFLRATRASFGAQALFGIGYGILLWLVNFQLIARAAYPWFLEVSQPLQVLLHAVAFGLPLGLQYAGIVQQPVMRARREGAEPLVREKRRRARRDERKGPPPPA